MQWPQYQIKRELLRRKKDSHISRSLGLVGTTLRAKQYRFLSYCTSPAHFNLFFGYHLVHQKQGEVVTGTAPLVWLVVDSNMDKGTKAVHSTKIFHIVYCRSRPRLAGLSYLYCSLPVQVYGSFCTSQLANSTTTGDGQQACRK